VQALLGFSALHQQVRRRRALASSRSGFDAAPSPEFESAENFVLDEVLQSVAERAIAITGADGLGIALAENNEIVLRASAGSIKPDVGARIQRDSAFSGACFRSAQIIRCDDSENDPRVNREACRELGARSMVAVPLCGRRRVIGVLEAFSAEPFGFNDSDVSSLELLAELILSAIKPEDEDRFASSAQIAEAELAAPEAAGQPALQMSVAAAAVASSPTADVPALDVPPVVAAFDASPNLEEAGACVTAETLPTPALLEPVVLSEDTKPIEIAEPPAPPEAASIVECAPAIEQPAKRHPGALLVLVLILVCTLIAGAVWWKLKTSQLGDGLLDFVKQQKSDLTLQLDRRSAATSPIAAKPAAADPTSESKAHTEAQETTSSTATSVAAEEDENVPDASASAGAADSAKPARINGIRHWSSADSSTVVLDLEDQVQYEAHRLSNPDRIYFDLHDTKLSSEMAGKAIDIGDALLARVRVAQPNPGLTRVVLETKGSPTYSVSMETNPYRLVVQVTKPGASPRSQIDLFPGSQQPKVAIVVPPPSREDLQLKAKVPKMRIVVDAGHGGWDLGTVGKHGLLEKDVVLEIAQRLGKLLESRLGAEVILTRDDDTYIPLDERAGIANQAQADLFVSVHANYSDLPSARGVETYYTNFFSSPNAKDMETRQVSSKPHVAGLSAADLHERIEQSRRLAASVQRSLYGNLSIQNPGLRDRGVKEASYVVLTETAMPGILAEVSFVSSPADEQRLRTDGYREQIAEALYKGIARYAATSRGVKVASAAK
jgi:N-acetylmuramoyl-L-alanine amidase/putative methionine-R-sulfoxide reductase with GAF domain